MVKKTVHGCTCIKDWVKVKGKLESGCIFGQIESKVCPATKDRRNASKKGCAPGDLTAWCEVQKGCGYSPDIDQDEKISDYRKEALKKSGGWWDYCQYGWKEGQAWKLRPEKTLVIKSIIGLIIFLVLTCLIIPYIFYYLGWMTLIDVWLPNIDLIATAISFRTGLWEPYFSWLWPSDDELVMDSLPKWFATIIRYISLISMFIIAGKHIALSGHLFRGISFALVMLILTYLIPNDIIRKIQGKIIAHTKCDSCDRPKGRIFVAVFVGLLVAMGFILIERIIISTQLHKLDKISLFITHKMWFFLGNTAERTYRKKRKKHKK